MKALPGLFLALCFLIGVPPRASVAQERAVNPHGTLKDACGTCHGPEGWTPARVARGFKHAEQTFPLVGAHAQTTCTACHKTLDFAGTSRACVSCHSDVHRGELGTDCARCHVPRSFIDRSRMVRAHQLTRFPLSGAHSVVDCEACHAPTQQGRMMFVSARSTCIECHTREYAATTTPPHEAAGFVQDCRQCHTTATWHGARFSHAATAFPLTGAHRTAVCTSCHGDGVYRGKTTDCYACHQADYAATANPPHGQLLYPTTCATCHTTDDWTGAAIDHDQRYFPIYSGKHRGRWIGCNTCHTNSSNFTQFTCLTCHEHSQQQMDDKHRGRSGYAYDSNLCYQCHRNGRAD